VLLRSLNIKGLRNLRKVALELEGRSALVWGSNGCGKTTLLEAIYLLARGRSFRGRRGGDLTTVGLEETRIGGTVDDGGLFVEWAFVRGGPQHGRWVDGVRALEWGHGRKGLAVRLVGENAAQLLDGDPSVRRRFLDWHLFHVEQGYGRALARYRIALEQRNAWLRQGARGRAIWDDELIAAGELLDRLRARGFQALARAFSDLGSAFEPLMGVVPVYLPGWRRNGSLAEALRAHFAADKSLRFTRVGPQRADFALVRAGSQVTLSRGQTKLAVCLLQLACDATELATSALRAIWLLDDIASDLDEPTAEQLISMFLPEGRQAIFTSIGSKPHPLWERLPGGTRRIHLLHGHIAMQP
jgi:DNA replication and repair protein RecF